ncbi:ankyrin repeat-containing domain protein [Globomyces pollinis-pini]|nr:ankyrin repeat-containing domain protein [Globomyces pollinis-pini]
MARLLVENGANLNQTLSMTDFFLLTRLNLSSKGHPNRSANSSSDSPMTRTFKESYRQYGQRGPIVFPQDYIDCKEIFPYELAMAADHHALGVLLLENIEKSSFGLFLAKDVSTVRLLLQAGAKTTVKDASGSTPLHLAARRGMIEIVIALVLAGADVNSKGLNGWTPLHEAASYCHSLTAHYLIHKGSSIQNLNNNEETPMELATRVGMDQATLDVIFNSIMFEQKERNLQISSQVPMELVSRKEKSKFPGLNFLRSSSNLGLFPADGTPADGKSEKSLATNMSSTSTSKTASTNGSQKRSLFGKNSKANIKKE